jgi:hypothetical protein
VALVASSANVSLASADSGLRVDILTFTPASSEEWEKLHRTSDSPPLRLAEVAKMKAAGIGDAALEEMVRTRRLVDRASADDLIALKKAGAEDKLIAAVSAYALPENRSIDVLMTVDVRSRHSVRQAPHLYVELWQTAKNKKQDLAHADLAALMARGRTIDDTSDLLLPERYRRVRVLGRLRAPHPGPMELRVLVTHRPDLTRLDDLPENSPDKKRIKVWKFELPAVSLYNDCELDIGLARDPLIVDLYAVERARWECTFE